MKRYGLTLEEKHIVLSIVRMNQINKSKRISMTAFDKRCDAAISKAIKEIDVNAQSPKVRNEIIRKIILSIVDTEASYENLGETYCSRGAFYYARSRFCFLVADNLGMIEPDRKVFLNGKRFQ